jgi:polyhydroxybutyrate depolymerase
MCWLMALVLALLFPVFGCDRVPLGASTCDYQKGGHCSVSVNGVTRSYVLHVPSNFRPGSSGLVVAFHGARDTGAGFAASSHLDETADKNGFAVAYPDGLTNPRGATSWNAYFNPTYGADAPDDSAFARALITTVQAKLRLDPRKIYVTGFSAGAHMAHRVAIDSSDLVAAAAIVEGSLWVQRAGGKLRPTPPRGPVSILIFHADKDQVVHYCGVDNGRVIEASQDESFDYWSRADSCKSVNTDSSLCSKFLGQPTPVTAKSATGCSSGTEVQFYRLSGGLHSWYSVPLNVPPGNSVRPYNANLNSSTGITTNDILWKFFAAHPKP